MRKRHTWWVLVLLLVGCAESRYVVVQDDKFVPETWKTLAVLPFRGSAAFGRAAGEFFAFQIQKQQHFRIVAPTVIDITLKRKGMHLALDSATSEDLQKLAQLVDVQAVFSGQITHYSLPMHIVVEAKLINVATGEVVATVTQSTNYGIFTSNVIASVTQSTSYGLLTAGADEHGHVTVAVKRAGAEMLKVLEGLSKRHSLQGERK